MKQHGFTIIELLVTLAILALLVGIGLPSMQETVKQNRIQGILENFSTAIKYTRSEAVGQRANVSICASSNQSSCTGSWQQGWIIFSDVDGAGDFDSGTDTLLRVGEAIETGYTLSFDYSSSPTSITFSGRGSTTGHTGTIKLCEPGKVAKYARGIILQRTGSLRFSVDSDLDGIYEDAGGTDFSCN
jgi:type IV fimbrial biogenesis protein FimT